MSEKKNMHLLRISNIIWGDDDKFEILLDLLKKYPCGISAISCFVSLFHPPMPLAEVEKQTKLLKRRMEEIRTRGLSAGINFLSTIGHHEEALDYCFSGDYYHMTNDIGEVCRGSFCMNDQRYIDDYVRPAYRMLAEAAPDHIWVDDDVRYIHWPIGYGCFCDGCIEKFNREHNTAYTRDTLREALDGRDLELRKAWLVHNSDAIYNLFCVIGKTVREINPNIILGYMTGERYFEGYDFARFADGLSDGGKYEIMWRPGGGAYEDIRFDDIVEKIEQIGRQNAYLPSYVTVIQAEIENFNYCKLRKTATSTAFEAAFGMTSGCTGAAFNILPNELGENGILVESFFKTINDRVPLYELLSEKTAGKQPYGICTGWRIDSQAATPAGRWTKTYGGMFADFARDMFEFGLPQCYDPRRACVLLLNDQCTDVWSDEEIRAALSGGVYMNAGALESLNAKGFSKYTGFTQGEEYPADTSECYKDVEINKNLGEGVRSCPQAFYKGEAYGIVPASEEAQIVSSLIDSITGQEKAVCGVGMYENELGGRICAAGYFPFQKVFDYYKTIQLKRIFKKLSKNTLPSYVDSYCRVRNHTFLEDGKCIVVLCNPSNETHSPVRVAINTASETATVYNQKGDSWAVYADAERDENYRFFTVAKIPAFEMVLIEVEK